MICTLLSYFWACCQVIGAQRELFSVLISDSLLLTIAEWAWIRFNERHSMIHCTQLRSDTRRQLPPRSLSFRLFETQTNVMRNCLIIGELSVKIVATRCQILWQKCAKFDIPQSPLGSFQRSPDLLAGYKGLLLCQPVYCWLTSRCAIALEAWSRGRAI